jgi:hypothetical protein
MPTPHYDYGWGSAWKSNLPPFLLCVLHENENSPPFGPYNPWVDFEKTIEIGTKNGISKGD